MRWTRSLFLAIVAATPLFLAPAVHAGEADGQNHWMAVFVQGKKAGWTRSRTTKKTEDDATVYVSEEETSLDIKRMGTPLHIAQASTVVEDAEGHVLRFSSTQSMGSGAMKAEGVVSDGQVSLTQNGSTTTFAFPEGAVGPWKAQQQILGDGLKEGRSGKLSTFSVQAPNEAVATTWSVGAPEEKDVLGRVLALHPVTVTVSLMPVPQTEWLDADGNILAIETDVPGLGKLTGYQTEESVARSPSDPAEVFVRTLVTPDRAIQDPRHLTRSVFRLSAKEGKLADVYVGEGQKIVARGEGSLDLEVDCWTPPADFHSYARPYTADAGADPAAMAPYLKATAYCESGDEVVKKLAAEAVGDETNALECAKLIQDYVRKKIRTKDFNVGFASAAEVARSLEGDCTEHAVLVAGIARALGLPARVVTGLVYVPPGIHVPGVGKTGAFGYHMWAEVYVGGGHWLPVDAAIGTFDATHIAIAKSDLASPNPVVDLVLPMLNVLGRLKIQVLEPQAAASDR